ncbi:cryptochrome/photolyase family protein [Sphingobacterium sp. HJSM2_6]|uniref:cryptochrome/photolyase family protein n=1 Tax=Sphingobacterium sp. HJSM2_6 TaxID=3366264 RepID=UPI003BCBEF38
MKEKVLIFWFQRDLRIADNVGLALALAQGIPVYPVFIIDPTLVHEHECIEDRSIDYMHQALVHVNLNLKTYGSRLHGYIGKPLEVFQSLAEQFDIQGIYCNRDYEPAYYQRISILKDQLQGTGILLWDAKDQVIFEQHDILKKDGTPYSVYGAYARKWKEKLQTIQLEAQPAALTNFYQTEWQEFLSLRQLGYLKTDVEFAAYEWDEYQISQYGDLRDFPGKGATTRIGVALRFGTISIRQCVLKAINLSEVWLNELIWREFFKQILYHFPDVEHQPFKKRFETFPWRNNEEEFVCWCLGRTGIPMVDAGMRELNETGFMHNRVRMIVASFLCKHLLIDWRWGEAYFAAKLLDYDLSSNNGNWQWVAGTGCDAAPFFRIFNPLVQAKRFDPDAVYVRRWVPEWEQKDIKPIVDLQEASKRALSVYRQFRESF